MLVGELIQRIQSLYSKGVHSQSTRLRNRHIYNKLLTVRNRLVSQEIKQRKRISPQHYQTLNCVELIEVPAHMCPCIPPTGCNIIRSKYKLPKFLNGLNGHIIHSVTTIDNQIKLDEITVNAVKYLKGDKYTHNKNNYFIYDGYLFLTEFTKMRAVNITGLFEDFTEVESFTTLCNTPNNECKDYLNMEFPIDVDMVETLIETSLNELIQIFANGIEDQTNNSIDSDVRQRK